MLFSCVQNDLEYRNHNNCNGSDFTHTLTRANIIDLLFKNEFSCVSFLELLKVDMINFMSYIPVLNGYLSCVTKNFPSFP